MASNTSPALDSLAILIQAIARDKKLLRWFLSLAEKSAVERRNEIFATINRMTAQNEDEKVTRSLFLLGEEKIFDAARQALRELGHIET